jgi:hypothetical protein
MSASHGDREAAQDAAPLDVDRLLSGDSGIVGPRARVRASLEDLFCDATLWARLVPARLSLAARQAERGGVLVLGLYSASFAGMMERSVTEIGRSRRPVRFALGALEDAAAPGLAEYTVASGLRGGGKFENLNRLLTEVPAEGFHWVVVVDDDVELPRRFLDRMLFVAERLELDLVQPSLRRTSHAAWRVFRREPWSVARLTRMVEIGPLIAFRDVVARELLPFPALRMGWGLDLHWGAVAAQRGWRPGVIDAVPIRHEARRTASGYDRGAAVEELRHFLAGRPHIDREAALTVVERHRTWG